MSEIKYLKTPLTDSEIKSLKSGDIVYLSGTIYTGRDAAHKRLVEAIANKTELPFDLQGSAIYYVGPTPPKPDQPIGSCGPTSSYRMDPYSEALMQKGLKMMIGKGPRSSEFKEQIKKYGAVYLSAIGGTGAKIQEAVKKSEVIAYPDLGAEAVHKLEVENFYAIVTYDSEGNDLFEKGIATYRKTKN
ncbi:MAG: Fe-S-containing hydro-lyase [Bacilli bacterium]|jgi:fumarate hydratase subunit beta|nr:Fe-S-containing hydro-lyase [Bacilli bacterium]HHU24325.1 Fe-S-containing hydro-lyase [Acholeplasmataceae bacterium]